MKKHCIFILLFLLILSMGCNKKIRLEKLKQTIIGSWEERKMISVYLTGGHASYSPGNGNIVTFKENTYAHIMRAGIFQKGEYMISLNRIGIVKKNVLTMTDYGLPKFFTIENNTLTLHDGTEKGDGTRVIYVRVKDPVLKTNK